MLKDVKCPNCGASLGGSNECEYCGTKFGFDMSQHEDVNVEILYSDGKEAARWIGNEMFTINEIRRMRTV